ncbi:hypothetical protein BO94DRAFT_323487 [Aspergillus sclerotioniger CBS 115572]|uniref:Uncharacterized protein n=1 Tax=Aspergillus sclerotioniger CBS 115572 TaxID=1450535 RepID=A0A317X6J4_9EURO|nr:hypothetical protein BO94DRAFT_323487 [Aspergillus sclerotioniger CBS 115572]PWY94183.1 hypothetical protein BO94DRAFT_323487 [Aspergillus sclerotioniger CBS 115572]
MYPFLPWSQNQSSVRSSLSEATTSTQNVSFSFSFGSSCSATSLPPPPPPSPTDSLLDITPRKCSFSSGYEMNNSCAFPSWPNRPSLLSADSESSTASAYLSDEDLLPMGSGSPSESAIDEESAAHDPTMGDGDLTTEQQIQMIRAAAEEEAQRARFLAQVQAHARAQQAMRVAQLAAAERENAKRKKRKAVPERKRRTASASKATVCRA